ncbi:MAG: isoprenylcysteine carboxylmethyltransferase family protein [Rhodothermales bacterium]|nr:isoprenylcysteine carboxylmethyltransferase family protein [Rhodothermales bacterium]
MTASDAYRGLFLGALLLNLGVSGYYRRRARQATGRIARRAEGGLLLAARLGVVVPLLVVMGLYVFRPAWIAWAQVPLPAGVRWAGGAVALAVVPLTAWVLRTLGPNVSETVLTKRGHALVTGGPYRYVRHPLYTAGLLLLGALSVLSASALMAALVAVVAVLIRVVVIPREEAHLRAAFGGAYAAYARTTGRLLPSLRR